MSSPSMRGADPRSAPCPRAPPPRRAGRGGMGTVERQSQCGQTAATRPVTPAGRRSPVLRPTCDAASGSDDVRARWPHPRRPRAHGVANVYRGTPRGPAYGADRLGLLGVLIGHRVKDLGSIPRQAARLRQWRWRGRSWGSLPQAHCAVVFSLSGGASRPTARDQGQWCPQRCSSGATSMAQARDSVKKAQVAMPRTGG